MRWAAIGACGAVLLATSAAQDLRSLNQKLEATFVGKDITLQQPYNSSQLTFDFNGRIVGRPIPTCDFDTPLRIDSVILKEDSLVLKGTRSSSRQVLMERSTGKPASGPSPRRVQHVAITMLSGGHPWDFAGVEAAINRIEHGTGNPVPNPPEARSPATGADARVLYVVPEGPVYKTGNGVSAPRAIEARDPEYSEEARRAKLCGFIKMKAVVLKDGSTSYIRVASPNIDHGLDQKSVEAVRRWRFAPAQLEGHPVNSEIMVTTTFRLY